LQFAKFRSGLGVVGVTKKLIGIEVNIKSAMIRGESVVEWFVSNGGDGVTDVLTD
jgi:hypothetical protein